MKGGICSTNTQTKSLPASWLSWFMYGWLVISVAALTFQFPILSPGSVWQSTLLCHFAVSSSRAADVIPEARPRIVRKDGCVIGLALSATLLKQRK